MKDRLGHAGVASTELSDRDFDRLARLARNEAGLIISEGKRVMVQSRLARHLRKIGAPNASDFLDSLDSADAADDRLELISVLTTNVSSFFREAHHFEYFATKVLPNLVAKSKNGGRVRIWSAGCSSGQEPFSLAMLILSNWRDAKTADVRILATDIDRNVIARARKARYSTSELASLPKTYARWVSVNANDGLIHHDVQNLVSFRELNLLDDWPMRGKFDAIFCRNVVIYFDQDTQKALWPRFRNALCDEGHLFLGHSERLSHDEAAHFTSSGITTYKKLAADTVRAA